MAAQTLKGRRVARSARGHLVDFDLLKMKSDMAANPKPVDVQKREDFIDQKLRRKTRSTGTMTKMEQLRQQQLEAKKLAEAAQVASAVEQPPVEETVPEVESAPVETAVSAKKIKLINQK